MYCNNCGANLPDGTKFCSSCGMPVILQDVNLPPQQPVYQQPPVQREIPYQQPPVQQVYQQPVQQPYPAYQQPYQPPSYYPPVIIQQNAPDVRDAEPERKTNGPAVAGIVFGILTLILLLICALAFPRAAVIMQNSNSGAYISDSEAMTFGGLIFMAMLCYGIACPLYLFNFIFGLIGFIRGLKNRVKIGAGVTAFVLLLLNGGLLLWELFAFVMTFAAMS